MTSDIEKFKQRREKFGNSSQIDGGFNKNSGLNLGLTDKDKEIKNKRRERFGGNDDKIEKTKEKGKIEFNADVINKRKERFGEISENDKRLIGKEGRQVRFGLKKGRRGFSFKNRSENGVNSKRRENNGFKRRGRGGRDERTVRKRREYNQGTRNGRGRGDFSNRRGVNRRRY